MAIAQALLLPIWVGGFAGLVGFGTLFFGRVAREEQMMLETFGDSYRTWRGQAGFPVDPLKLVFPNRPEEYLQEYLRSAESCHFRNIRREKFTRSLAREPIRCVCNIVRLILDAPLVAARGFNAEIRDR